MNQFFGHRLNERFGMCSTFKVLLVGWILREAEMGRLSLDEAIHYSDDDLLANSPVTSIHVEEGKLTIGQLAKASVIESDNGATNLLLKRMKGPKAFTSFMRSLGDNVTRLDRYELAMNLVPKGEERDTTTPHAMAKSLSHLLLGDSLGKRFRALLISWMEDTQRGAKRIRAGLPQSWRAGNRPGTGIHPSMENKCNDLAIIWPPNREPLVVTTYYEADGHYEFVRDSDEAVLSEVGKIVSNQL